MIDVSPIQMLMVLAIALLVFGPRRLPELGRSIGRGIREFRATLQPDDAPQGARRPEPEPPPPPPSEAPSDDLAGLIVPGDAPPASSYDEDGSSGAER